jgi:hypothetical protein
MKTPFTDAATLIVHAGGKALPVTPASVAQLLERRLNQLEYSQDFAWSIIKLADWSHQSLEWKQSARDWQENIFLNRELPLAFTPGHKPANDEEMPKTLPDALRIIAELRQERHQSSQRLSQAEVLLEELEKVIEQIEHEQFRAIHQN